MYVVILRLIDNSSYGLRHFATLSPFGLDVVFHYKGIDGVIHKHYV